MKYATWKLNFSDSKYGTGPEDKIAELGFGAEAAWISGESDTATILGYITEPVDESELTTWEVKNITQQEALDFCLAINPEAYLLDDGRIAAPVQDRFA